MQTKTTVAVKTELFQRPESFVRQNKKQFLYAPYSRKLHRRTYCYTHARYDLWAMVESDTSVKTYNELPEKIAVSCDGKVRHVRPAFAVEKHSGEIAIHFIDRDAEEQEDERLDTESVSGMQNSIATWCTEYGFKAVFWTPQSLRAEPVYLANLKQLLRYACIPLHHVSLILVEQVCAVVRERRKCSVDHVVHTLSKQDEDSVMAAVAKMILDGQCFSDITRHPFHYSTELSVHHAIE